jgi:hypothetical protein
VVTIDDVALIAAKLPEVTEGERYGNRTWVVGGKAFAWVRPGVARSDRRRPAGLRAAEARRRVPGPLSAVSRARAVPQASGRF